MTRAIMASRIQRCGGANTTAEAVALLLEEGKAGKEGGRGGGSASCGIEEPSRELSRFMELLADSSPSATVALGQVESRGSSRGLSSCGSTTLDGSRGES